MKSPSKLRALRFFGILAFQLFSIFPLAAILDLNNNGMSDVWEEQYNNGELYPATFLPSNDPDEDGWNNATEAVAGTDPFEANPPDGIVVTQLEPTQTQGGYTITWPTIVGKRYRLQASYELDAWFSVGNSIFATGSSHSMGISAAQPDSTVPPKIFWRIIVADVDDDNDLLTNAEEYQLGTNPTIKDTDGDLIDDLAEILAATNPRDNDTDEDGIPDNLDTTPLVNNAIADPDGANLPAALNTYNFGKKLIARYDFENTFSSNNVIDYGKHPSSMNLSGLTVPTSGSLNVIANNTSWDIIQNPAGLPSRTVRWSAVTSAPSSNTTPIPNLQHLAIPRSVFNGNSTFSVCYWLKCPKDLLVGAKQYSLLGIGHDTTGSGGRPTLHWYIDTVDGTIKVETYRLNAQIQQTIVNIATAPEVLNDGNWHHICLSKSGSTYNTYIDGVKATTTFSSQTSITLNNLTSTAYCLIGRADLTTHSDELDQRFPVGTHLDRLRIYSSSLNATDALALYNQDIDNDGLYDRTEARERFWYDRNNNGTRNADESEYVARPFHHDDVGTDHDRDGISSHNEQNADVKTNGSRIDTEEDLLPDGWEVNHGLNPLVDDANGDLDGDGVKNIDEYRNASNPNSIDSDGDGTSDYTEIAQGSHPNDNRDAGQPIPSSEKLPILLGVGDESTSHSEDYVINCYKIDPDTGEEKQYYVLRSGGQGQYAEETISVFRKEDTYTFQIKWLSSSLQQNYNDGEPDFDYTLKIQPSSSDYSGKFIDSYDYTAKKLTDNITILGIKLNNVNNFVDTIENKRVALVNLKMEWKPFGEFNNISDHIDPWENVAKGKKITPDYENPNSNTLRDKVQILISNGLPNLEVNVKSFDVDDSTSEEFDNDLFGDDSIIDTESHGNDNFSESGTEFSKHGYLWDGSNWTDSSATIKLNETGQNSIDFKVSMQPGDNYRAVCEVLPSQIIDQVQSSDESAPQYLGFEDTQKPNLPVSPSLTVWRQLWLEEDSMSSIPLDVYGYKKNNLPSLGVMPQVILSAQLTASGNTKLFVNSIDDYSSSKNLDNAKIIVNSQTYDVETYAQSTNIFEIPGNHVNDILPNMEFRLYDDDDFGVIGDIFPKNNAYGSIKKLFTPAFVELKDASPYNATKYIPFYRNHGTVAGFPFFWHAGIFADALDLTSSNELWVANLLYAYQGSLGDDRDPNTEEALEGGTPSNRRYSIVYCETVREILDDVMRFPGSDNQSLNEILKRNIYLTGAHEIGHMPGSGTEDEHHSETFLMEQGYQDDESENKYSPQTIKRFRSTKNWQQP